jgi:Spy/CpxP family protein refolding chaperone
MVTGILVGAVVLALGATAFAQGRGGRGNHGEKGKHEGIGRLVEELNLTVDQKTKIGGLHEETNVKAKPIEEKIRVLKDQERAAWQSDKPDEAKIVALHREMRSLKGDLDEHRIAQRFDMMEVLTADQRIAAVSLFMRRPHRGERDERNE